MAVMWAGTLPQVAFMHIVALSVGQRDAGTDRVTEILRPLEQTDSAKGPLSNTLELGGDVIRHGIAAVIGAEFRPVVT